MLSDLDTPFTMVDLLVAYQASRMLTMADLDAEVKLTPVGGVQCRYS